MKLIPPRGRTALGLALLCLLAVPAVAQDAAVSSDPGAEAGEPTDEPFAQERVAVMQDPFARAL